MDLQHAIEMYNYCPQIMTRMDPPRDISNVNSFFNEFVSAVGFSGDLPTDSFLPFTCEWAAIYFLMMTGILSVPPICSNNSCPRPTSRRPMVLRLWQKRWQCPDCTGTRTLFTDSVFKNSNSPAHILLKVFYFFLLDIPMTSMSVMLGLSRKTIYSLVKNCRLLIESDLINATEGNFYTSIYFILYSIVTYLLISYSSNFLDEQIGGPGIIVEIDESKFGKRKYGVGGAVEGNYLLIY